MNEQYIGIAAAVVAIIGMMIIPHLPADVRPIVFIVYWVIFLYAIEFITGSRRER